MWTVILKTDEQNLHPSFPSLQSSHGYASLFAAHCSSVHIARNGEDEEASVSAIIVVDEEVGMFWPGVQLPSPCWKNEQSKKKTLEKIAGLRPEGPIVSLFNHNIKDVDLDPHLEFQP